MKGNRIVRLFYLLLLVCSLVLGLQSAFAAQTFQNNLVKADVYKSSLGGVKLTLYTNAPYTEQVYVNKKSDTEYVVLMPETSNSLTANPSLDSVSDVVKSVAVKTQQYDNKLKGYTKILITTTKPVEIVPQVQALSSSAYKVTESDYKELLSQVKQKPTAKVAVKKEAAKQVSKPAEKPVAKTAVKPQIPLEKIQTKLWTSDKKQTVKQVISKQPEKIAQAPVSKPVLQKKEAVVKPVTKVVQPTVQTPPQRPKVNVPGETTTAPPVAQAPKTVEPEINPATGQPDVTKDIITPPTPPKQAITPPVGVETQKDFISRIKSSHKFIMAKNIIKTNFYMICGLLASMFIILLIIARRISKNHKTEKAFFTANLQDQPMATKDYTEIISDEDMNWKEKYQSFVDASGQAETVPVPPEIGESLNEFEELDQLFGEEDIPVPPVPGTEGYQEYTEEVLPAFESVSGFEETREPSVESYMSQFEAPETAEEALTGGDLEDLFGEEKSEPDFAKVSSDMEKPFDELYEEAQAQGYFEEDEMVKSEFVIDDGKGFYLVNVEGKTALVGHINDEIFVLKTFDEEVNAPIKARLDEHKGNSVNYMTRVGDFKGLVQVTPRDMNLLIEL